MGAGAAVNYSDLPKGARVLPSAPQEQYSDLPEGATVLPARASAPEQPGFLSTLGREASSLGSSITGIPGGVYHAFADDPSIAEQAEYGDAAEMRPGFANRAALGVERLSGQPLINAVRWYKQAAQGQIPNAYEQALSVAPEAVGAGVSAPVAGKLMETAPQAVSAIKGAGPNLGAKAAALSKLGVQEGISHIPIAGRLVRRPSYGDLLTAIRSKNDPALSQAGGLARLPVTGAMPAAQTGEALGRIPVAAARPPLIEQMQAPEVSAEPEVAAPQSRLIDQMREAGAPPEASAEQPGLTVKATKDYPRLVEQMKAPPELTRPVTENRVVGSFVRAMQKSGMPIAERPNLLLKGSGRINRILGPEEELTDVLSKSVRRATRQRGQ